jgi:hypothetical protein
MVHRIEVKNKSLLHVPSSRRSRKKGHPRGWRDRVTSGSRQTGSWHLDEMYGPPHDCKRKIGPHRSLRKCIRPFWWGLALLARMSCAPTFPDKSVGRCRPFSVAGLRHVVVSAPSLFSVPMQTLVEKVDEHCVRSGLTMPRLWQRKLGTLLRSTRLPRRLIITEARYFFRRGVKISRA